MESSNIVSIKFNRFSKHAGQSLETWKLICGQSLVHKNLGKGKVVEVTKKGHIVISVQFEQAKKLGVLSYSAQVGDVVFDTLFIDATVYQEINSANVSSSSSSPSTEKGMNQVLPSYSNKTSGTKSNAVHEQSPASQTPMTQSTSSKMKQLQDLLSCDEQGANDYCKQVQAVFPFYIIGYSSILEAIKAYKSRDGSYPVEAIAQKAYELLPYKKKVKFDKAQAKAKKKEGNRASKAVNSPVQPIVKSPEHAPITPSQQRSANSSTNFTRIFSTYQPPAQTFPVRREVGPDPTNPEAVRAYQMMEESVPCLFITGRAGTGKSYLLNYFRKRTRKSVVVLAPTGLAAAQIDGVTIHSFFHFPLGVIDRKDTCFNISKESKKLFQSIDTIVIDEVSMVNSNLIDAIDHFLRLNGKDSKKPFGGIQIVLFGDPYQLPPVITSDLRPYFNDQYRSEFFFDAHVFEQGQAVLQVVELKKNYRQNETDFIQLLNAFRENDVDASQLEFLNRRYVPDEQPVHRSYTTLTSQRLPADKINKRFLNALPGTAFTFTAVVTGEFKDAPADKELTLKPDAFVMFLKNDKLERWVNGSLGQIVRHEREGLHVRVLNSGRQFIVEREKWEKFRYRYNEETGKVTTETTGTFTQYPLALAWAMTIHKSQGQTLEKVAIDLGRGAFAPGQVYVGLSRCKTLQGLLLKTRISRYDIKEHPARIIEFMGTVLN